MAKIIDIYALIAGCTGFDWDEGNDVKNWSKHHVSQIECESVFLNGPVVRFDPAHSKREKRFLALGMTDQERHLSVCFTFRGPKIRVISARDMTRREHKEWQQYEEANPRV